MDGHAESHDDKEVSVYLNTNNVTTSEGVGVQEFVAVKLLKLAL